LKITVDQSLIGGEEILKAGLAEWIALHLKIHVTVLNDVFAQWGHHHARTRERNSIRENRLCSPVQSVWENLHCVLFLVLRGTMQPETTEWTATGRSEFRKMLMAEEISFYSTEFKLRNTFFNFLYF
jgi:hypothetical protein